MSSSVDTWGIPSYPLKGKEQRGEVLDQKLAIRIITRKDFILDWTQDQTYMLNGFERY